LLQSIIMSKELSNATDAVNQGKKLYYEWNFEDSKSVFRKIAESHQNKDEGFYGLGLISFQTGELDTAAKCFKDCLHENAHHADALFYLGKTSVRQNDYPKAISYFKLSLHVNPKHYAAKRLLHSTILSLLNKAKYLYQRRHFEESEKCYKAIADSGDLQAAGYYGLGVINYQRRQLDEAKSNLEHCIKLYPRHANAYYYLGLIAQRQDKPQESLADFQMAISINPKHFGALKQTTPKMPKVITSANSAQPRSVPVQNGNMTAQITSPGNAPPAVTSKPATLLFALLMALGACIIIYILASPVNQHSGIVPRYLAKVISIAAIVIIMAIIRKVYSNFQAGYAAKK
jgi:tetratricopeptide (TPR) repeat protein